MFIICKLSLLLRLHDMHYALLQAFATPSVKCLAAYTWLAMPWCRLAYARHLLDLLAIASASLRRLTSRSCQLCDCRKICCSEVKSVDLRWLSFTAHSQRVPDAAASSGTTTLLVSVPAHAELVSNVKIMQHGDRANPREHELAC